MPVRVQLSRRKGWRMPENTISVARPGPLGNPFVVGKHGTREECVHLYRVLLSGYLVLSTGPELAEQKAAVAAVKERLPDLRGKNLACWCRLDGKPCHADALLEIANQFNATPGTTPSRAPELPGKSLGKDSTP